MIHRDPTVAPVGGPVCEVLTVAKRDLKAGEHLDGIGGYSTYGLVENFHTARAASALPIALSENCLVIRDVPKDQALTLADVVMPPGLLVEMLWREQMARWSGTSPDAHCRRRRLRT